MKIILSAAAMLLCINLFAQDLNPCLFVGSTSIKNSICSDKKWVREEVKDRKEYDQKRTQYREDNKLNSYSGIGGGFVSAKECAIVYEYKAHISGFNCTPTVYGFIKGATLENCKKQMNTYYTKFPKEYETQPKIIYEWCGKGTMEEQTNGGTISGGGGINSNDGNGSDSNVNGGNTHINTNSSCPTYGFKFSTPPSYNCVALEWWALSKKVNSVDAAGNFKQSSDPEAKSFTIEFRKQGELNWTSERRDNTGQNVHTLSGLDACTQYEVRLIAICTNNAVSTPSNTVRFTTACTKPGALSIENVTKSSAKVSSERLTAVVTFPCSSKAKTQVLIVEYKSSTSVKQEVICNSGNPCILNALQPATTYRVRARFQYGNNLYSSYTNEVSFTIGQ